MDEGFDFHWYAGKAPYFVTPEGRKLYCKLRGRVPVIGDGSIATPAQDEKAAHDVSYTSVRRILKGIRPSLSARQPLEQRRRGMRPQLCQHSRAPMSHVALRWRPSTGKS